MINFTLEQINKAFEQLPDDVSLSMSRIDIEGELKKIAVQYAIKEDFVKQLDFLITLKIIKLLDSGSFKDEVFELRGIEYPVLQNIFSDIKENILNKIDLQTEVITERKRVERASNVELFQPLPKKVQEAINFSGWSDSLFELMKKHNLNIEQSGILEDITIKTIAGKIPTEDYHREISLKLSLDKEKISEIVSAINENIFQKIRDLMREEDDSKGVETKASDIPIPPYKNIKNDIIKIPKPNIEEIPIPNYAPKKYSEKKQGSEVNSAGEDNNHLKIRELISNQNKNPVVGTTIEENFTPQKSLSNNINVEKDKEISSSYIKVSDPYRETV